MGARCGAAAGAVVGGQRVARRLRKVLGMSGNAEGMGATAAGFGVGDVAGGSGAGASEGRYCASNVVLLDVGHVRVMRGETDEVLERMRSREVEREVVGIFEECGVAPDWFVDRWVEGSDGAAGQLVTVAVFEDAAAAAKFGDEAKKRSGCVRWRDDAGMVDEMAAYFSAEWQKAHEAGLSRFKETLAKCDEAGWLGRSFVGQIEADGDDGCRARLKMLRTALEDVFGEDYTENEATSPIAYGAIYDKGQKMLSVCVVERGEGLKVARPERVLMSIRNCGIDFALASERWTGGGMGDAEMSLVANVAGRVMCEEVAKVGGGTSAPSAPSEPVEEAKVDGD